MERGKLGHPVVPPQKLFGRLPSLLSDPFPHNPDPSFLGLQKGRMGAAERMEGEKTENGLGGRRDAAADFDGRSESLCLSLGIYDVQ